jgi:CheY-like chemotaxis protein
MFQNLRAMSQTILVVDDDDLIRSSLVHLLEELGYRVAEAEDGASGVAAALSGAQDLVMIDFAMPGMSGAAVAEAIRAERPEQRMLLISGYAQTSVVQSAAGDIPILGKPFGLTELKQAVADALSRQARDGALTRA